MTVEIEQAKAELRQTTAEAAKAEIELAAASDSERDRLVKPGRIRHLYIDAPIYDTTVAKWVSALEHWELRDPGEPVNITINSPGGEVLAGFSLFDTILRLRRKGHTVTTRGTGMIASMATILMQGGEERILDANSWFMIHEVSARSSGSQSEMADQVAFVKRLNDRIYDILAERSTLTRRQIVSRSKRKDDWMSAPEAVKLGFADRVE